jgi:GGDEF domain-containing protein
MDESVWYWHCCPGGVDRIPSLQEARLLTRAASLAVPALLLSAAAGLAVARTLPDWLATGLRAAPLAVFIGGGLLGLLVRRGWVVLGLVVLALADLALTLGGHRAVYQVVALLLPLNLGVIAWLGETSLLTVRGAAPLGAIVLQAGAVAVLQRPELAAVTAVLNQPLVAMTQTSWTTLPQPALGAFALALGLVLAHSLVGGRPLAVGVTWALVASFLALDGAGSGRPATAHLVIAGLLLVAGAMLEPRRAAYLDGVTGLPGRLALNAALRRLPRRYALASVEIDDFRAFRAEHGVDAGRRMLRLVAGALAKVGGGGRAYYCEGPAFAVVFRRRTAAAAVRRLDVVRRAVERATLDIRVADRRHPARARAVERTVAVTISAGVAQPERRGVTPDEVLLAAGRALDVAKLAGLNRVVAAGPEEERSCRSGPR